MFKDAKTGDRVWDVRFGWGVVKGIRKDRGFPLWVYFEGVCSLSYTFEGEASMAGVNPTLFWDEIKFEIPKKPLPKLEVDTKVIVWDENEYGSYHITHNRYFSHFDEDGRICTFANGATSWSRSGTIAWDKWELENDK